ncbi:nucleoside monophosphate kinase [Candidatus Daviesbacteria bacterium]|nr:nucleoside monophosphate kinase [Candidatus Daviesbacteria bacterium]
MKERILLIGPQGAGKSSQGKLLAEFLQVPLISTGDILRNLAEGGTESGKELGKIMTNGGLIDDKIISQIVQQRLAQPDCRDGFIMDGYPRTLNQIEYFDPLFNQVFYLKLSDEEATGRLLKRGRIDDTEEAIVQRLKIYHTETDPIIDYYNRQNLVSVIDGTGTIEQVQQRMREALNGQSQK